MPTESIALSPKTRFCANAAAANAHSEIMASPAFQSAAASALLEYQYRTCPAEPTVLAIAASKLKGAQEFLAVLLNLGIPEQRAAHVPGYALEPPEQSLNRPYQPPASQ